MAAVDSTVPVYPIGVVQRLTGLSARQIRYYEKEGLLKPSRTRGNRRLYSSAEVQRLRQVKNLLAQGLNLEGVRAYLAAEEAAGQGAGLPSGEGGGLSPGARVAAAPAAPPAPGASFEPPEGDLAPGPAVPAAAASPAGPGEPTAGADGEPMLRHPAIFRQARGLRLSSLFPVDHPEELVQLLERTRAGDEQSASS